MTLWGRTKVVIVLSALAVWLAPATVSAAFWIVLDRTSGPSGAVVHGRTLGSGSVTLAASRSLPMFLVHGALASQITDPADDRLIRLGDLVVDADGDGTTTFTIPAVAPGNYAVLVHCEPCAPSSAGAEMLLGAELEVSLTSPATDTIDSATGTVDAATFEARLLYALVVAVASLFVSRRVDRRRFNRA